MSTHLAYRLPWETLGEVYANFRLVSRGLGRMFIKYESVLSDVDQRKIEYFANCLSDAIQEFSQTDKRPPIDEDDQSLDLTTWDNENRRITHCYAGMYYSLLRGYIEFNLILSDPDKFLYIMQRGGSCAPSGVRSCAWGELGSYPDYMSSRIRWIFKNYNELHPLSAPILQAMRDHAAFLFRCLYSIGKEAHPNIGADFVDYTDVNKALDPHFIADIIRPEYI